jgi:hypothetical protein
MKYKSLIILLYFWLRTENQLLKIWRFILLLFSHLEIENLTKNRSPLWPQTKKKKALLPRASHRVPEG